MAIKLRYWNNSLRVDGDCSCGGAGDDGRQLWLQRGGEKGGEIYRP